MVIVLVAVVVAVAVVGFSCSCFCSCSSCCCCGGGGCRYVGMSEFQSLGSSRAQANPIDFVDSLVGLLFLLKGNV